MLTRSDFVPNIWCFGTLDLLLLRSGAPTVDVSCSGQHSAHCPHTELSNVKAPSTLPEASQYLEMPGRPDPMGWAGDGTWFLPPAMQAGSIAQISCFQL